MSIGCDRKRIAPLNTRCKLVYQTLVLTAVLMLSACIGLPTEEEIKDRAQAWASRQQQLRELDMWEIHARAVIHVNKAVYQVGINWVRNQQHNNIIIEAPFGKGLFRLAYQPTHAAQLTMPDGQIYFDHSAETLLRRVLNWPVPISSLESWIKGLPLAVTDYQHQLRSDGRLRSLQQDGWDIDYSGYFDIGSEQQGLPRKIYLTDTDIALKIVIERWHSQRVVDDRSILFPDFD